MAYSESEAQLIKENEMLKKKLEIALKGLRKLENFTYSHGLNKAGDMVKTIRKRIHELTIPTQI